MRKLISVVFLVGTLALYAFTKTSSGKENFEISFPETEELYGRVIPLDTALFRYPYRLRVNKDRVIVEDLHGVDHFFHLFTYPDFRYLSSFGQRGRGPEEMLSVDGCFWQNNSFLTLDNIKSELVRWDLNAQQDGMLRENRIKLEAFAARTLDIVPFHDNYLIPDYSGINRFCQVDKDGKLMKRWGEIPTENKKDLQKYPFAFGYGWRSFIDYSQKNGVLAAVTQFGEVLEIWNVKKNTHQVLKGKLGEPKFEVRSNYALPVGVKGSSDIQVTDRAIYVVFRGVSMKEEMLAHQKGKPLPQGGKTIRVFSLDGTPLKEYKLDHSVSGIWVDEQMGKIWAVDVNSDEPLVEYNIK